MNLNPGPAATAPETTAGAGTDGPDDGWLRVHPASPFVRGWVALAAIGFFFGRDTFERMLQGGPLIDEQVAGRAPWLLLGGGTFLLLTVAGYILSWYFTRYQVAEGYVRVNTGFLFKQQRQARLDRVQAIDIVQPLLARIFGLAELKFEVADAGESAVRLAYLPMDQARQLRATILARAAGVEPDPARPEEAAAEAPENAVLTVPPPRLVGSLLLSEQSAFILLGAVASVVLSAVTENRSFYLYLIPAGLGLVAAYWNSFNKGYNFTAAISPDGIRLRYGLLDTQAQTLPPGRIQALRISQPPLWRIFGWYRMQVNVAGYGTAGSNGEGSSRTTLLPVGTLPEVFTMLSLVLPDPGTADPARVFAAGLHGIAPVSGAGGGPGEESDGGFVTTPRRARPLAPLGWRRNGFTATDTALLIRSGRWWRQLVVVPHQRTQSMALQRGPLARRFGLVDLALHTTSGPVSPRLIQAGIAEGKALLDAQAARARAARKRQTSEHWLEQVKPLVAGTGHEAGTDDPEASSKEGPQHG
ncbi:putative membrane protein [Arthrobacter sp. UYCu712]